MSDVKRYKVSNGLLIIRGAAAWDTFNLKHLDVVLASDYDALAADLADWQRMRNEMRDVAFANRIECDGLAAELAQCRARLSELAAQKPATLRQVLRKIVDTAQEHPAKANFVAVHRQLIGEARELLTPAETVAEPKCEQCVYDIGNPGVCERCGTPRRVVCKYPGCLAPYDYHHAHTEKTKGEQG